MAAPAKQDALRRGLYVEWTLTREQQVGEEVMMCDYPFKTITVEGGVVTMVGRMRNGGVVHEIVDVAGKSIKGAGISEVRMNPRVIWPVWTSGKLVTVCIVGTTAGGN